MTLHRQVRIEHNGNSADVDEGIAPLILALWRRGFQTTGSCEHQDGTPVAWISFETLEQAEQFQRLAGGTVFTPDADDAAGLTEAELASNQGAAAVAFPVEEIPSKLAAIERAGN